MKKGHWVSMLGCSKHVDVGLVYEFIASTSIVRWNSRVAASSKLDLISKQMVP